MPTPNAQLKAILDAVDRPGASAAAGQHVGPMPILSIEGVGQLSFPIVASHAEAVLAIAEAAPYGRGPDTLVDRDVRRAGQIAPAHVTLGGRAWTDTLDAIVRAATRDLGADGDVYAELYKLLVYEPGDFFTAHRDSEKVDGMFATLVVVFPAAFSGGELVVRHAGAEDVFALQCGDPSVLSWAAFYADCEHEIRPLQSGHRICLTYNLIRTGAPLRPPNQDTHITALERFLRAWNVDEWPDKLVYLLEHRYTPPGLTIAGLKNTDQSAAGVLRAAAERADCDAFLAMIQIEECGGAYATEWADDGYGSRYGRRGWGGGSTVTAFETVDPERTQSIEGWRRLDDQPLDMAALPFEDFELAPMGALDDAAPDEETFYEATGNEGGSFERSYRRAALVVWPARNAARVLASGPLLPTLGFIEGLLRGGDPRAEAITQAVIGRFRLASRRDAPEVAQRMLQLIETQEKPALLETFIIQALPTAITPILAEQLVPVLRLIDWAADPLIDALDATAPTPLPGWACLLRRLAESAGPAQRLAEALRPTMLAQLPEHAPPVRRWQRIEVEAPEAVTDLLVGMGSAPADTRARLTNHLRQHRPRYALDATLIPALCALTADQRAPFGALVSDCVAHLEARIAVDITPPTHWRQSETLDCKCEDCAKLQRFIAADQRVEWFSVAKERRRHLHRQIDDHRCDMTHSTERKGRPFTLVCTKTRAKSEALATQRVADLEALAALRSTEDA